MRSATGWAVAALVVAAAGCGESEKLPVARKTGAAADAGAVEDARTDAGALGWELVGTLKVDAYNGLVGQTAVLDGAFYGLEIGAGWEFARYDPKDGARTPITITGDSGGLHEDSGRCQAGSRVYFLGGGGNGVFSMYVDPHYEVVDLATRAWLPGGDHPAAYHAPGIAAGDGRCVMLGGNAGGGLEPVTAVQELDLAKGTWKALPPLPKAVVRPGGVITGGLVVSAGGARDLEPGDTTSTSNGVAVADVWLLEPGAQAWKAGPALPRALHGPELFLARGRVFCAGGVANGDPVPRPEILSWAHGEASWRVEGAIPPDPSVGSHAFAIGDDVYVVVFVTTPEEYENRLYRWAK